MIQNGPKVISHQYAAGFFDGEGSVLLDVRDETSYSLRAKVSNTNFEILELLATKYGGSISSHGSRKLRHKLAKAWRVSDKKAVAFLLKIQPFLVVKKEAVRVALQYLNFDKSFQRHKPITQEELSYRASVRSQLQKVNRRGVVEHGGI
jgi:intein-encoded DNA endonuclease-like protein